MSIIKFRDIQCPDFFLKSVADDLLRKYAHGKTPETKTQAGLDCIFLARILRNVIDPILRHQETWETYSKAHTAFWAVSERLIDVGRPHAQEDLLIEFCPPDKWAVLHDQIENLTLQVRALSEGMQREKPPTPAELRERGQTAWNSPNGSWRAVA